MAKKKPTDNISKVKFEEIEVDKLIPYARNARKHSDDQILQIAASIREFGFLAPVVISADNTVIAGHGRLAAAKKLELPTVPCVRADHLSKAQVKAYSLVDNRLTDASSWDIDLLKLELDEVMQEIPTLETIGFDNAFRKSIESTQIEPEYEPTNPESPEDVTQDEPVTFEHTCPNCGHVFYSESVLSQYGIPYMGSKSDIAEEICRVFPTAEHFYDLFGGGFSITHCMMINRSDFKQFHYNDLDSRLSNLLRDAIAGKYNYSVFKPEWISREQFFARKDQDVYVSLIWSFGNTQTRYLFGTEIEEYKKSMHQAVVFGEFDQLAIGVLGIEKWNTDDIHARRMFLRQKIEYYRKTQIPKILHKFLSEKQLERLQQLQQLQQLRFSSLDYRQVDIKNKSVIYCDVPYENTSNYRGMKFDHTQFFDWAANSHHPVYFSEYKDLSSDDRFEKVGQFSRGVKLQPTGSKAKDNELLYWNKKGVSK